MARPAGRSRRPRLVYLSVGLAVAAAAAVSVGAAPASASPTTTTAPAPAAAEGPEGLGPPLPPLRSTGEPARWSSWPLLVTVAGFGTAAAILAVPVLRERPTDGRRRPRGGEPRRVSRAAARARARPRR